MLCLDNPTSLSHFVQGFVPLGDYFAFPMHLVSFWWLLLPLPFLALVWLLRKPPVVFHLGKEKFTVYVRCFGKLQYPDFFSRKGYDVKGWYRSPKFDRCHKWNFDAYRVFTKTKLYGIQHKSETPYQDSIKNEVPPVVVG